MFNFNLGSIQFIRTEVTLNDTVQEGTFAQQLV